MTDRISVTFMPASFVVARLFDAATTIGDVAVPAGHYAVDMDGVVYTIPKDVFESRHVPMDGARYAECVKRFPAIWDGDSFIVQGRKVPASELLPKVVWCDDQDEPFAAGDAPASAVMSRVLDDYPARRHVGYILSALRRNGDIDPENVEEFDRIAASEVSVQEEPDESPGMDALATAVRELFGR